MKRALIVAATITPIIAAGAGVIVARMANAGQPQTPCAAPTVTLDVAENAALVTAGPQSIATCEGTTCSVQGAEQVEVLADGRVQCVNVEEGQVLALSRRGNGLSLVVSEIGR